MAKTDKEIEYEKKKEQITDMDIFWEAWDFCENEFGNMWRDIKLDDKRLLVLEKYENLNNLRELTPYKVKE